MSALFNATTIFVDFKNVLARTDEFVCRVLYNSLKDNIELRQSSIIHSFFDIIDQTGLEYIENFVNVKETLNPLRELADINKIPVDRLTQYHDQGVDDDTILDIECNLLYEQILTLKYPLLSMMDNMKLTIFGESIKILLKDVNVEKVYVYMENITDSIVEWMASVFMNNDKIVLVDGDKEKFFADMKIDTVILNDSMDIEKFPSILNPSEHDKKTEVVLLNTTYNYNLWFGYFLDEKDNTHNSVSQRYQIDCSLMKN